MRPREEAVKQIAVSNPWEDGDLVSSIRLYTTRQLRDEVAATMHRATPIEKKTTQYDIL